MGGGLDDIHGYGIEWMGNWMSFFAGSTWDAMDVRDGIIRPALASHKSEFVCACV